MINRNRYNYDFSNLEDAMFALKDRQDQHTLNTIKKELNKFFKDSTCVDVIYTKNTDKLFFGMCTLAVIGGDDVANILVSNEPVRIDKYYIEIDSKLIDIMELNKRELTAILLHEVGHLVNDSTPINEVRKEIDHYMSKHGDVLSIKDSLHFKEVLAYAIKDSLRKTTSLFTRNDDEILADEFVFMCGYGEDLQSAFQKICKSVGKLNTQVTNKFMVLEWTLFVYKNMKLQRINAIRTLNKAKRITASKLEQMELDNVTQSISKIDDIAVQEATYIREEANKKNSLLEKVQRKGLRSLEEDVFEYEMRIKNVADEDEAILILRQVNTRMSILDDYLMSPDLQDGERARWQKTFDRYDNLREELSKKMVYSKKRYGLFVDYNHFDDMYR